MVAVYAFQIAKLIGWQHLEQHGTSLLMRALLHDAPEVVSGDMPSPAKTPAVKEALADYLARSPTLRPITEIDSTVLTNGALTIEIVRIIKAADKLDGLLFTSMEIELGNKHIAPRFNHHLSALQEAWFNLPDTNNCLRALWEQAVLPAIDEHRRTGGVGL